MELDTSVVTNTVVTMFLVLCVGYATRKLKFLDGEIQKKLSDIIICVGQPFLIIYSILSINYSPEKLREGLFVIVLGFGIHAAVSAAAFIIAAALVRKKDGGERTITEFGLIFANCGFLGIPVLKALFGDVGGFWAAFYIIVFNVFQWTYGMTVLGRGRKDIKINFKSMLLNYGTVPCFIGITLFALRVRLPGPVMGAANYVGSLCTPISMLIIGGTIATIPLKKLFTNLKIYCMALFKLIVIPAAVIIVCAAIGLSSDMVIFAAVMSALPTAANVAMFSEKYDIAPGFASHAVGMITLLSALTVPLVIKFSQFILSLR